MRVHLSKLPVPDHAFASIFDITPQFLQTENISLLFMDLDNTMAPYSKDAPSPRLRRWIRELKEAHIEPFILSNNRGARPSLFAKQLEIDYLGAAKKPSPFHLLRLIRRKGADPKTAALVGDQIYTDVLCAKQAGIRSMIVQPMDIRNPVLALRYGLESPFRLAFHLRSSKRRKML